jgi:hypothetical protein
VSAKQLYNLLMKRWFGAPHANPVHTTHDSAARVLLHMPPLLHPGRFFPWSSWGVNLKEDYDRISQIRSMRTQKVRAFEQLRLKIRHCILNSGNGDPAVRLMVCNSVSKKGYTAFCDALNLYT